MVNNQDIKKVLLEPHLKQRLGFEDNPKVRFQGCEWVLAEFAAPSKTVENKDIIAIFCWFEYCRLAKIGGCSQEGSLISY